MCIEFAPHLSHLCAVKPPLRQPAWVSSCFYSQKRTGTVCRKTKIKDTLCAWCSLSLSMAVTRTLLARTCRNDTHMCMRKIDAPVHPLCTCTRHASIASALTPLLLHRHSSRGCGSPSPFGEESRSGKDDRDDGDGRRCCHANPHGPAAAVCASHRVL